MKQSRRRFVLCAWSAGIALCAMPAGATTVQDLVRIKGHERNTLVGLGLVIGLNGTGDDSKDSLLAARPYEQLLANLGNPIESIEELADADSYALVHVTMEIPATGIRSGDRLDVSVSTLFNASSLAGGELVMSPLRVPLPEAAGLRPMAFANGPLVIEGDNPRRGLVRGGGQMIVDVRSNPLTASGTLTLVLKDQYAGYPVATTVARALNDEFAIDALPDIAIVEDAKNIRIFVPSAYHAEAPRFIANLLMVPIDSSMVRPGARIIINEAQGIILVTGDVEVGPVLVAHKGLSITSITPEPEPSPQRPRVKRQRFAEVNTTESSSRISTQMKDLLAAFDQLNVPIEDQIAILHELSKTGKLHAEIVHQ